MYFDQSKVTKNARLFLFRSSVCRTYIFSLKMRSYFETVISMPLLFLLISRHFKPLTEIRTYLKQIEAEAAKKSRTMSLGKIYWSYFKK